MDVGTGKYRVWNEKLKTTIATMRLWHGMLSVCFTVSLMSGAAGPEFDGTSSTQALE
jgi:hypothetical protein